MTTRKEDVASHKLAKKIGKWATEIRSEHSNKVDNGAAINTHTHLDEKTQICPIREMAFQSSVCCVKDLCAWFSFDDDCCAVVALVKALGALYDWETERS